MNTIKKYLILINAIIDDIAFKLSLILTYFTIPIFLLYTFYHVYKFNIVKILLGLLISYTLVDLNKKISGGKIK